MTQPRSQIVQPERTRHYHCVARCVRRAWLCGEDDYTGKNFDHRKSWLLARMKTLEEIFAIRIAAYAVMSNHYHVVLYLDIEQGRSWNRDEVIRRWLRLFSGDPLARAYLRGGLDGAAHGQLDVLAARWRERLCDLSWYMRCLNEYLARRANAEDGCKGRFWEGRFKSQALADDAALLSCMAYVDLNPVRAGLCGTLADSDFTSVRARLWERAEAAKGDRACDTKGEAPLPAPKLMPFRPGGELRKIALAEAVGSKPKAELPFALEDYLELVDWTGRLARPEKRGMIAPDAPAALSELGLDAAQWRVLTLEIQKRAIVLFHGLERVEAWERRHMKKAA